MGATGHHGRRSHKSKVLDTVYSAATSLFFYDTHYQQSLDFIPMFICIICLYLEHLESAATQFGRILAGLIHSDASS